MLVSRKIRQLGMVSALLVTLFAGNSVSPARAVNCEATAPLNLATKTTDYLPDSGKISRYDFASRVANSSGYQTRFALAKTDGLFTTLSPTFVKVGQSSDQLVLAQRFSALVHVNGDYFDFGNSQPYGDFGLDGKFIYAHPGMSNVIGLEKVQATSATGIVGPSHLTTRAGKVTVFGYDLKSLRENSIVAFDSQYTSSKILLGQYSVQVVGAAVTNVWPLGTETKPTKGYVLTALGAKAVASLKKLKLRSYATYSKPTGTTVVPRADDITPNVSVSNSSSTISANAVNYQNSTLNASVVLYDIHWNGTTPGGVASMVVDANNNITSIQNEGSEQVLSSGERIVKFFTTQSAFQLRNFSVGQKVNIHDGWSSLSGAKFVNVFGYHERLITEGNLVAPCSAGAEIIRPRTAVGWDTSGNIFLATTTMGRDWPDNFYRVGGSSLHQIADWMRLEGAKYAVGLDGGGSTTMFADIGGEQKRLDLPSTTWGRLIPQGVAIVKR